MTWLPNVFGAPIELVHPRVEQVNFDAMAHALAHLNRSSGHPATPVSVGLHLLIGLPLAEDALKPWWLLHDGHEERIGEITSPMKEALRAVALQTGGPAAATRLDEALKELTYRHDAVIHAAAGLPLPNEEQKAALREIDCRALATERRDFYARSSRPWSAAIETAVPSRKRSIWMAPPDIAFALRRAFEAYLPAFQPGHQKRSA